MDIIKEYFKKFTDKDWDKVYLREIALLMEQMDELRGELMVKENLLKNYKREDILAEINMLKVLVWSLWEEAHGGIKKGDWESMKDEIIKKMREKK